MEDNPVVSFALTVLSIPWLWMLIELLNNTHITGDRRMWWMIYFVVLAPIAPTHYYFAHYRKRT